MLALRCQHATAVYHREVADRLGALLRTDPCEIDPGADIDEIARRWISLIQRRFNGRDHGLLPSRRTELFAQVKAWCRRSEFGGCPPGCGPNGPRRTKNPGHDASGLLAAKVPTGCPTAPQRCRACPIRRGPRRNVSFQRSGFFIIVVTRRSGHRKDATSSVSLRGGRRPPANHSPPKHRRPNRHRGRSSRHPWHRTRHRIHRSVTFFSYQVCRRNDDDGTRIDHDDYDPPGDHDDGGADDHNGTVARQRGCIVPWWNKHTDSPHTHLHRVCPQHDTHRYHVVVMGCEWRVGYGHPPRKWLPTGLRGRDIHKRPSVRRPNQPGGWVLSNRHGYPDKRWLVAGVRRPTGHGVGIGLTVRQTCPTVPTWDTLG